MTGRRGSLLILPLLIVPALLAADSLDSAAHELARRIPHGLRSPVSLSVRTLCDLGPQEVEAVRRIVEGELSRPALAVAEGGAGDEVRVTLSQSFEGYLLAAEVRRGDERQVLLVSWTVPVRSGSAAAVTVEKTLLTVQREPILDIARADTDLLMLQPGRIVRLVADNGRWTERDSAAFPAVALPRDPRGRLVVQGGAYLAYLPGAICSGAVSPLDARCREADEPWPLSAQPPLRARFDRAKNFFEGRLPFYSVAAAGTPTGPQWVLTHLDGRAYLHDGSFDALASLGAWGSDIAGLGASCGGGSLVLASRSSYGGEADSLRVFQIADRQALEAAAPVDLPGPVTALWPAGDNAAIAVAHDTSSGEYAAYRLATTCGH